MTPSIKNLTTQRKGTDHPNACMLMRCWHWAGCSFGAQVHIVKMEKSNSMGSLLIWQPKQKVWAAFHSSFLPRVMGQLPQNTGTQFLESQGPVPKGWRMNRTPNSLHRLSGCESGRNQVCRIQTLQHMVVIHEARVQELSKKVANISHGVLSLQFCSETHSQLSWAPKACRLQV